MSAINQTNCRIRELSYLLPSAPCDRCQQPAAHYSTAERLIIDLDLDQPVLLLVTVSVLQCRDCHHYFRAQPPFARTAATYSRRVVRKAVEAVHRDGLAMRRVPERLACDFWVAPSEAMVRQWCKVYEATFDFEGDYQPWVVREFSGILCVDEVYQDQLALLLAVDPAASDGDRLVGYQLVHGEVDGAVIDKFLSHLREAGIQPEEVITDGSALYPAVLAKVWPTAAHQLCLFHETRHVTRAAMELIQAARATVPHPPPQGGCPSLRGRLLDQPPTADPGDPAYQRWQLRQGMRQAGIAQVHSLARQGLSQRAISRQLGIARQTVHRWLQCGPPAQVSDDLAQSWRRRALPDVEAEHRARRQARREAARRLAQQGLSYSAIAREVGIHRVTVKAWLRQDASSADDASCKAASGLPLSSGPEVDGRRGEETGSTAELARIEEPAQQTGCSPTVEAAAPPAPWTSWDQLNRLREALRKHRFLLLYRPEHLTGDQQAEVTALLASPLPQLQIARSFLVEWYLLWQDELGQRRTLAEAENRYEAWRRNPIYRAEPVLRRALDQMTESRFQRLSSFLRHPHWEATNNGAERVGRTFRHRQAAHFNLRSESSIEGALVVAAFRRMTVGDNAPLLQAARSTRGRTRRAQAYV